MTPGPFRGRRLRRTAALRAMARETHLCPAQLVAPLFVCEGQGVRQPIASLPGRARLSPDLAAAEAADLAALGIGAVPLFGIPGTKDQTGSGAWADAGPVPHAIRRIKREVPDLVVWADVCLCEYTSHGHCGELRGDTVDSDATPAIAGAALACAEAGADVIAPSDMMDGRVAALRTGLDGAGHHDTVIVSYAVKYASAFYGPFRDAAGSTPQLGDRRGYQMDPANVREAVRERVDVPVAAYQVSGEFAMLHAAAERGWVDLPPAMHETSTALRRAGADLLITYFARALAHAAPPAPRPAAHAETRS